MSRWNRISLNSILLKELRQSVRSRSIAGAYCIFLLLQAIVTGVVLIWTLSEGHSTDAMLGVGRSVFQALFVPLSLVCVLFVPLYAGVRMAGERSDEHLDLQFITRLSPAAILRGKFLSSLVLIALMTSAALPFLTLTFRLGGIDMPSVLLVILTMMLVAALASLLALLTGALPGSRAWRVLLGLGGLTTLFYMMLGLQFAATAMIEGGVASGIASAAFWQVAGSLVGGGVILGGMFFCLCLARISPPAANRALPIRVWVAISWFAWGVAMIALAITKKEEGYLFLWSVPTVLYCVGAFAASICERPDFGRRLRRSIPSRLLPRLLVYSFFSGAAPAMLWTVLIALTTIAVMTLVFPFTWSFSSPGAKPPQRHWESITVVSGVLAYAFAYSQTAFWLWHWFGRKWLARAHIWVVFSVLVSLGSVAPMLAGLPGGLRRRHELGAWIVGNPFALFDEVTRNDALLFAVAWSALMLAPFLILLGKSFKKFKPLDPAEGSAGIKVEP